MPLHQSHQNKRRTSTVTSALLSGNLFDVEPKYRPNFKGNKVNLVNNFEGITLQFRRDRNRHLETFFDIINPIVNASPVIRRIRFQCRSTTSLVARYNTMFQRVDSALQRRGVGYTRTHVSGKNNWGAMVFYLNSFLGQNGV
jgi:hypothetical protein